MRCEPARGRVSPLGILFGEPGFAFQIIVQVLDHAVQVGEKALIFGQVHEPFLGRRPEQPDRAVVERFKQIGIDAAK